MTAPALPAIEHGTTRGYQRCVKRVEGSCDRCKASIRTYGTQRRAKEIASRPNMVTLPARVLADLYVNSAVPAQAKFDRAVGPHPIDKAIRDLDSQYR